MGYSLESDDSKCSTYVHVKKVAVIGAGVAGLQLAERLGKKSGLEVTIFEKTNKVGGVWSANYADFGLQVPKELYEFPAFPYPEGKSWDKFPKGAQVQEYIEAFAEHAGLRQLIRFDTSVLSLQKRERGWLVTHAPNGQGTEGVQEPFDFVVVATGMYGGASPHIPSAPGKEEFEGALLHSFHFREREQARGKRVVVVGGGKSAVDCAVAAVKGGAEEVTLLFRAAHWPVPRYILNLIPFKFATYSRFGHALLPTHHDVSSLVWWLHALFTPLKWLVWRLVEIIFRLQFQIPKEMLPRSRIEIDVFTGGQILTYEARDLINAGKLKICRDAIARYTPAGVALKQGAPISCDMVVYGTGFTKTYNYLEPCVRDALQLQRDGLYLYRSVLPVGVPDIAFLGAEVSTFNNILTHGLQAAWLSSVLGGEVKLPSASEMQRSVEQEMHWKRTWMPSTSARAAIQQLHMPKYHDKLVEDMGFGACRKSNPLFEVFVPYTARDYRPIFGLADTTKSSNWMRLKETLAVILALLLFSPLMLSGRK
ncbi:hypothetical protein EMIHUDRAFT_413815 [Emiliania huxleyi CCMP1516]|uniref:Flavin-containing monooxygenase n=2 Tax=Emiliania huxleyi TaxID=2903 RepID=A0A0D3JYF8_EMIH1|nr:hypothetical protein EMIHUDRAFT_413815 [Emiliania huxleyi CCMP1516]EOD28543.1 hypothetical protein EMIHUDRAFT_413815 [Emiliania huxleyi CCMP1516]|eukprot:XP_005780972.1 hypothetical protein EMIHUDRAFT_413815 [Emiliania huxleyi CCMP1516]